MPCVLGGAKSEGEEGRGNMERQGGVPLCAPLPREWGMEGPGGSVLPFCANGGVPFPAQPPERVDGGLSRVRVACSRVDERWRGRTWCALIARKWG